MQTGFQTLVLLCALQPGLTTQQPMCVWARGVEEAAKMMMEKGHRMNVGEENRYRAKWKLVNNQRNYFRMGVEENGCSLPLLKASKAVWSSK